MPIYLKVSKIDIERVKWGFDKIKISGEEFVINQVPDYIFRYHKKKKDDGNEAITLLTKKGGLIGEIETLDRVFNLEVYLAEKNLSIHPLADFFPNSEIEDLRGSSIPSAVFYISSNDEWYAITINRGYIFIGAFIDLEFPVNIARRIMDQSVKNTKERDITGVVYGRIQQFRTNQLAESQSIGTIWSGLDGYIENDVRNSRDFTDIFNPKQKRVGISVNTGVEIRSALNDYNKLLEGLVWIQNKDHTPLTAKERRKFAQLDGIKEIKHNELGLIGSLENTLAKNIQDSILASSHIDLDFSHTDFVDYQSMDIFCPKERTKESDLSFSTAPTADEIIMGYYSKGWIDPLVTEDEFVKQLKQNHILSYKAGHRSKGLSDSLYNHLHGEIEFNGKGYFFIDGRWYRIDNKFEANLRTDFQDLISSEFFVTSAIPTLKRWTSGMTEGDFNDRHKGGNKFIVGDRAFLNNIEIADIIHIEGNIIHIYHNKVGFGASTRDVCSQVLQSMTWLTRIRKERDRTGLGEYYDNIVTKHYPSGLWISKDDFIDLMLNKSTTINYVVGYVRKNKLSVSSRSNIAKFEILKLCKFDKRLFDFDLKVLWIKMP